MDDREQTERIVSRKVLLSIYSIKKQRYGRLLPITLFKQLLHLLHKSQKQLFLRLPCHNFPLLLSSLVGYKVWLENVLKLSISSTSIERLMYFQFVVEYFFYCLTLSWRRPLSYRNWFLYDNGLRHERVIHIMLELKP